MAGCSANRSRGWRIGLAAKAGSPIRGSVSPPLATIDQSPGGAVLALAMQSIECWRNPTHQREADTNMNTWKAPCSGARAGVVALLSVGTGCANSQSSHPTTAADANAITAIDILLEPDATMVQHAETANARLRVRPFITSVAPGPPPGSSRAWS